MKTEKQNNPHAFPHDLRNPYNGNIMGQEMGMTLRDYFAAKAMQAICAGDGARMVADRDERYDETNWAEIVAKNSYEFADTMLKQREL